MFTLTQTGTTTIKLSKTSKSKQLLYKLCFTVEQPLIHETADLFPVKIEKRPFKMKNNYFDRVCTRACA
jgi:hypothetical protein